MVGRVGANMRRVTDCNSEEYMNLFMNDSWAMKKERHETAEGARKYRAINQEIKKSIKKAKESWIDI